MTRKQPLILSAMLALFFNFPSVQAAELIDRIDDAYYSITQTNPPQLHVVARGYVSSGGWGFPKLVPYLRQQPPAQGVLEFDFIATPPSSGRMVIKGNTPIGANNLLHDYYPSIQAIKINSRTNSRLIKVIPPTIADSYGSGR
ncbi:MAG TPA: hypothetical protein VIU36_00570 [Gammaproteobacteria bacterium]